MSTEDLDVNDLFGEINGFISNECCDNIQNRKINDNIIVLNYPILAHNDKDGCGNDRKFFVNLHIDGSWSFTFSDGELLSSNQENYYCREISGAQSRLTNERKWKLNGRGLGVWDNFGSMQGQRPITIDSNTQYFNSGNFNDRSSGSCGIMGNVDLKRPT